MNTETIGTEENFNIKVPQRTKHREVKQRQNRGRDGGLGMQSGSRLGTREDCVARAKPANQAASVEQTGRVVWVAQRGEQGAGEANRKFIGK